MSDRDCVMSDLDIAQLPAIARWRQLCDLTGRELDGMVTVSIAPHTTMDNLICSYKKGAISPLTGEQWERVIAERRKCGHRLDQDELLLILGDVR